MEKIDNKKKGYVMAGAGFLMILVNALSYLLGWHTNFTPVGIIGIVFVVIGMNWIKMSK